MPLAEQVVAGLGTADVDRLPPAVRAAAEGALAVLAVHETAIANVPADDVPSRAARLAVRAHADAGHDDPGGRPEAPCGCGLAAAALGAAAVWDATGPAVVGAVALGLELQLRLVRGLGAAHGATGWDPAGTAGPPAAALAAALVAGVAPDRVAHAVGIATSLTLGHGEASGTDVGSSTVGQVAANGLLAAALAVHGSTATATALEGPRGYFHVLGADAAADGLLDASGGQWLTEATPPGPQAQPGGLVAGLRNAAPEQVRRLARRLLEPDGDGPDVQETG
jgi:2-methylcitrate dehydratase PrpD